jgi:hypothetical protein
VLVSGIKGLWYLDRQEIDDALCTALIFVVASDHEAKGDAPTLSTGPYVL